MTDPTGFLDRWSRRKQAGLPEEPTPDPAPAEAAPADPPARTDDEILADLGLVHPDTLGPGDDIKGFMNAAVPGHLRRIALRQLWRGNPVLANLDELVDYGGDFTDAATVIDDLKTVYQVGRGIVREKPAPDETALATEEPAPAQDPAESQDAESQDTDSPNHAAADDPEPPARPAQSVAPEGETSGQMAPVRRRMAFRKPKEVSHCEKPLIWP